MIRVYARKEISHLGIKALFLIWICFIISCSGGKKSIAIETGPWVENLTKLWKIDSMELKNEYNIETKENSSTNTFIRFIKDGNGNIVKLSRHIVKPFGEKLNHFYFDGSNLIASRQMETNSVRVKGKLWCEENLFVFKDQQSVLAKTRTLELKLTKKTEWMSRIKAINYKDLKSTGNIYRDEMALIKKIRQL